MREEDARMCASHGADILGFVVEYPNPVPWNLDIQAARELIARIPAPAKSCVVTGGAREHIMRVATQTKPDYIQLHCGESLKDTTYLVNALGEQGIKIIKTLFPNTPGLEQAAADFCAAGVYALLFDPRTPDNAANGGLADISAFLRLKQAASCPVILAGGINPENIAGFICKVRPEIIDLMTGVEQSPGIKDEAKVAALFRYNSKLAS